MKRSSALIIAGLILFVFYPRPAEAYIDPGTGSMILQLLLAGIAGLAVLLKVFWHRIMAFFYKRNKTSQSSLSDTGESESSDGDEKATANSEAPH